MKKGGIINRQLCAQIAGLGHTDRFLVCDAGFPIPKDAQCVDLAVTFGSPTLAECVEALLCEVVVEEVIIAREMVENNKKGADYIRRRFQNQKISTLAQEELAKLGGEAKFIVRSGEVEPYSNVLFTAASGVYEYRKDYLLEAE